MQRQLILGGNVPKNMLDIYLCLISLSIRMITVFTTLAVIRWGGGEGENVLSRCHRL